ncbi:MAG TPA: D-alanyl-D-alanine carboxypeptidase, partial [Pyrinomonadaceae bacterium]|nr:D-alanyl-D-alanine carboxypeptidase [Pyrinomonadaceae bacterium]
MNRRQPIYWILACGLVAIGVLTSIPHFIKARVIVDEAAALVVQRKEARSDKAAKPVDAKPSFDATNWYASRGESPDTHGVLIETLDGKRVLASLNADATFNPASLLKLATSLVALKKLGANYRFQTRVFLEGDLDGKKGAQSRLYVSSNDPTFGDAGASLIAKELKARGVDRLSEVVVSPEFCFNFDNSAEESAGRLAKALKLGNPKTSVADGASGQQILTVNSNPLSDILLYM